MRKRSVILAATVLVGLQLSGAQAHEAHDAQQVPVDGWRRLGAGRNGD